MGGQARSSYQACATTASRCSRARRAVRRSEGCMDLSELKFIPLCCGEIVACESVNGRLPWYNIASAEVNKAC
jgi:hypothetical protein